MSATVLKYSRQNTKQLHLNNKDLKHEVMTSSFLCMSLFFMARKSFRVNLKFSGVIYGNCPRIRCKPAFACLVYFLYSHVLIGV